MMPKTPAQKKRPVPMAAAKTFLDDKFSLQPASNSLILFIIDFFSWFDLSDWIKTAGQ